MAEYKIHRMAIGVGIFFFYVSRRTGCRKTRRLTFFIRAYHKNSRPKNAELAKKLLFTDDKTSILHAASVLSLPLYSCASFVVF